jgi:hypothetical protein
VSAEVGFALRAPWYVRERTNGFSLRDAPALRPTIQMYDGTGFVERLLADPRDSLQYTADDLWSYPVPVTGLDLLTGRERLATSRLVTTNLRKLYQPSHSRFYAVVVEVFCDAPGLPRAGAHDDIELAMVMRRQHTVISGASKPIRTLARNLMVEMMTAQHPGVTPGEPDLDVRDIWTASESRRLFEEQNADLLALVEADTTDQAWMVGPAGGQWRPVGQPPTGGRPPDTEEEFPMWRLPARPEDCDAARTRSLWFGLVPTYSADHWVDACGRARPKLDDRSIYQLRCVARRKPRPGHEHCPRTPYWSQPSEPFRLASPFDPDGTKNRTVSITLPDLRRLAARAGQRQGPGGVRISTPPQSQFVFNPFTEGLPPSGSGRIGAGGGICTFAFELFFIVAFFLFILFLPIVVFAFQLWWMLALRFCIPPSASFDALADFFADGGLVADLAVDVELNVELDLTFGTESEVFAPGAPERGAWARQLDEAEDPEGDPIFRNDSELMEALVVATDPTDAVKPEPPPLEEKPADPLCPQP